MYPEETKNEKDTNTLTFIAALFTIARASQVGLVVKNPLANEGDMRPGSAPWVGKISWRKTRQSSPVFLPGAFHGPRSLAGYSLQGHKELDMTEVT